MPEPALRRFPRAWRHLGAVAALALLAIVAGASSGCRRGATVTYVGDQSCVSCHQAQASTYPLTAHALTSRAASRESVPGSFEPGKNVLRTANAALHFQMNAEATGLSQSAILKTSPTETLTRTEPMDIVIGSGRKGQTYLYWEHDELRQLPVSYWTEQRKWVNSPGYTDGKANFERPIARRCLECHATSVVSLAPPENRYDRASLALGISCEKCHGPGAEHVARYRSKSPPRSLERSAIVNPARLPRERQIDVCALCHAGQGHAVTPPLTYRPGDVLSEHIVFPPQPADAPLDVHASQVQLLQRSRCFQASPTMTCSTCHDVHQPQRDLAAMATTCATCHQVEDCGMFPVHGPRLATSCVPCHMPLEQTAQIVISGQAGGTLQPKVRNHRIAIYPDHPPP